MRKMGVVTQTGRDHDAIDFLMNSMICHIDAPGGNMKMKAVYLGLMIRRSASFIFLTHFYRLIQAELGVTDVDDRDFYGNKRIELAGSLLSLLFEDLFKR